MRSYISGLFWGLILSVVILYLIPMLVEYLKESR